MLSCNKQPITEFNCAQTFQLHCVAQMIDNITQYTYIIICVQFTAFLVYIQIVSTEHHLSKVDIFYLFISEWTSARFTPFVNILTCYATHMEFNLEHMDCAVQLLIWKI